jgi:hypothetical protein
MLECTALMVVNDLDNEVEKYICVELDILDGILPENNTKDISSMVKLCNAGYTGSENVEFIDMYGIQIKDKIELWETMI